MSVDPTQYVAPDVAFTLAGGLYLLMAIIAGIHVILNKQNEASAFSWLGIIILAPLLGAVLYWLFGINRIRRRAQAELSEHSPVSSAHNREQVAEISHCPPGWQALMQLGLGVHDSDYLTSNNLTPLINGDEAYPQMLNAINNAKECVVLSSYIFEHDEAGRQFVDALAAAHDRGIAVRVLIDGLGVGYGFSMVRSDRVLRKRGVKTARFLSALSSTGTRFINLRNHRKILSVDGEVAFVGGMNIRQGNVIKSSTKQRLSQLTQDVHFKVHGPVINQINAVFAADWEFACGEALNLPRWKDPDSDLSGDDDAKASVVTRVLVDGPDDNYQKLQLTMLGAINAAKDRVCIVSPYFLPGALILSALQMAVLRGVRVDVCIPGRNNLPFVGWAMRANRRRLLAHGVHIHESAAPFDHSKLFLIDDYWSLIGSSNWDSRSLELNFEINLESYDIALNHSIAEIINEKLQTAVEITDCTDQNFIKRLRNNFFRMFSPYL